MSEANIGITSHVHRVMVTAIDLANEESLYPGVKCQKLPTVFSPPLLQNIINLKGTKHGVIICKVWQGWQVSLRGEESSS